MRFLDLEVILNCRNKPYRVVGQVGLNFKKLFRMLL